MHSTLAKFEIHHFFINAKENFVTVLEQFFMLHNILAH